MTKKQYFWFLWPLSCMRAIISLISHSRFPPLFSVYGHSPMTSVLIHPLFSIFLYTIALLLGLYFAIKIGARLLFLDDQYQYDVGRDILKPAVLWGVVYV